MSQKPRCAQNSKNCRKNMSLPLTAFVLEKTTARIWSRAIRDPRERLVKPCSLH